MFQPLIPNSHKKFGKKSSGQSLLHPLFATESNDGNNREILP
jgi:hypothetical protein